jgi:hypothetical protein
MAHLASTLGLVPTNQCGPCMFKKAWYCTNKSTGTMLIKYRKALYYRSTSTVNQQGPQGIVPVRTYGTWVQA